MSLFVLNNKSIYHHHIPKTGGSTIIQGLIKSGAIYTIGGKDPITKVSNGHLHLQDLERVYPAYKNHLQFTVIRHPWHRLISEYVWKKQDQSFGELNKWIKSRLCKFLRNPYLDDNHFRPQVEFINSKVKIFTTHNLKNCQDFLCNYFDLEIEFPKVQVSQTYKIPTIDILNTDNIKLFNQIYEQDLILYQNYIGNKNEDF